MSDLTPSVPGEPTRLTVEQYFALVEAGLLARASDPSAAASALLPGR